MKTTKIPCSHCKQPLPIADDDVESFAFDLLTAILYNGPIAIYCENCMKKLQPLLHLKHSPEQRDAHKN